MAKTVTASMKLMTDGQVDNLVDKFRAAVRKHRSEFGSDAVQQVLGVENLGMELFMPFRRRVETVSAMVVVRRVKVNRDRSPRQALEATGKSLCVVESVVETMPRGDGEEMEVSFFMVDYPISYNDLGKEYDLRGFKPADPYTLAAVNEDDPDFAYAHPNDTHWKDAGGKWCSAGFIHWYNVREVHVDHCSASGLGGGRRWFAGLRK